jgi:hypothetical protein
MNGENVIWQMFYFTSLKSFRNKHVVYVYSLYPITVNLQIILCITFRS